MLFPSGAGHWRYRCGDWTAGLAEVFASRAYRRPRRCGDHDDALGDTEVARWGELLDYRAKLRAPRIVTHELPQEVAAAATAVARGVLLLLALRDDRWGEQGFTFARRFAAAWCDIGEDGARRGLRELREAGWLVFDGMQGRAYRWCLAEIIEEATS
ncbi:MAG: hypothetical protein ACR2NV_06620 [Thermoleophilaceae bacterium]